MQEENLFTPNCIRTFTGKYVNIFEPKPEMFCIEDIAHALSMQPRFGGHLRAFYSVAEHSINAANYRDAVYSRKLSFDLLMHDCSEAYLLDIPSPIKAHLSNYVEIEDKLMRILADKFSFEYPLTQAVKDIDRIMLQVEWNELAISSVPRSLPFGGTPNDVREHFLFLYHKLKP